MLVGIHRERYGKFSPFLRRYEQILEHNGIPCRRVDASQSDFWDVVSRLDLFVFRWGHYDDDRQMARTVLPIVENELGVPCFPNQKTCWHYDDKIRQYYLLRLRGFPIVESWVFWERDPALEWARTAEYPVMFKLAGGAGSQNVVLVRSPGEARTLINRMFGPGVLSDAIPLSDATRWKDFSPYRFIRHQAGNVARRLRRQDPSPFWQIHKNYALFQRFLPGNAFDTRVTVIGERAFGFRRLVRAGDYRASGSGRIDHDPGKVDLRCVEIALGISRDLGFQSMAYDFLKDRDGNPQFCEISYTYADWAIHDCPGYWDANLDWCKGRFWPQYFHLIDALGKPDLSQPDDL